MAIPSCIPSSTTPCASQYPPHNCPTDCIFRPWPLQGCTCRHGDIFYPKYHFIICKVQGVSIACWIWRDWVSFLLVPLVQCSYTPATIFWGRAMRTGSMKGPKHMEMFLNPDNSICGCQNRAFYTTTQFFTSTYFQIFQRSLRGPDDICTHVT